MPEDENHHILDEWERLGLDKRIDFENLKRVFDRLDLKVFPRLIFLKIRFKFSLKTAQQCHILKVRHIITTGNFFSSQKDGRIDIEELESQYLTLGYKPRKMTEYGCSEVEDVIWEVSTLFMNYIMLSTQEIVGLILALRMLNLKPGR